jgi:hypothetical protein
MRKRKFLFVTILSGLLLWGCYPEGPEYAKDMDVVITNYNPGYDFVAKGTYAMPDRIVKITGNQMEGDAPVFIPDVIATQILTMIKTNMQTLGWTYVNLDASPDLLLTPASWETTTLLYYYDYWDWWYGGYPGYGWGYYPPVYTSSYTTGTLMMNLFDKNSLGGNGNPILQWTGALNGILTSTFDAVRIKSLIDQAFKQSPYLKTN